MGLTCPIVQKADASVIMGGDGEGLVWVTHHLVDLGWDWNGGRGKGRKGQRANQGDQDRHKRGH
jgi:hypothetical protein